ncbi:hypothetical protein [Curvivirga sp.]|uniref:hypothetical protein n=1 Tax=Curvivirga sp. TaxID=2856848 RepID=UPI003B5AB186
MNRHKAKVRDYIARRLNTSRMQADILWGGILIGLNFLLCSVAIDNINYAKFVGLTFGIYVAYVALFLAIGFRNFGRNYFEKINAYEDG